MDILTHRLCQMLMFRCVTFLTAIFAKVPAIGAAILAIENKSIISPEHDIKSSRVR
ncbi:MAG: hypothetical protein F6K39_48165 [Okeania sp. SIO3B3]|nr:hypothetical protein [Okeania sp. SIO3B3]